MKRLLGFLGVVFFAVAAWMAAAVVVGVETGKAQQSRGLQRVIAERWARDTDAAGPVVVEITTMRPRSETDRWTAAGIAAIHDDAAAPDRRPFTATVRNLCRSYGEPRCWLVDSMTPGQLPERRASAAEGERNLGNIRLVQQRLEDVGFNPGAKDGKLGVSTREAIKEYQKLFGFFVDGKPTKELVAHLDTQGRFARAARAYARGDVHEAVREYDTVVSFEPDNADAYFNRGLIYQQLGLAALAREDFDTALAFDPDLGRARLGRGNLYLAAGNYLPAVQDYLAAMFDVVPGDWSFDKLREDLTIWTHRADSTVRGES